MTDGLPWRGPGPQRPELPLPPDRVPLRRQGSWRKRWRYLGAFSDELLLCAARVGVGPLGQTFWSVWDRDAAEMRERTRLLGPVARGEVWTEAAGPDHTGRIDWAPDEGGALVRIEAPGRDDGQPVRAFLRVGEGDWVESVCPTGDEGGGYVWTRKRIVAVECDVRIGERRIRCEARGIEDESCGYHPKHTVWDWSAGVGRTTDGRDVGWNLVSGINDPPERSERAIWVDGRASEPGPVDLRGPRGDRPRRRAARVLGRVRAPEAGEARLRRVLLPPAVRHLQRHPARRASSSSAAFGVMEHHDAHW